MNWGGLAFDPGRRLAVMAVNRIAQAITLVPREDAPGVGGSGARRASTFPRKALHTARCRRW